MHRFTALFLAALALCAAPAHAEQFKFDPEHTAIIFRIDHLGFSDMIGRFTAFEGGFDFDRQRPDSSSVDVTIHPASVATSSKALDEKLQGADWFNTAKFPDAHFVSTRIHHTSPHDAEITGDLTLLGVTRPVVLRVHFNKADYMPVNNNYVAGFSADTEIKRSDFGMKQYVPMVGDEVRIHIEAEGISQEKKPGKPMKQP